LDREQFFRWLDQIYATTEGEFDCERFQALLPAYVECEVGGQAPAERYPGASAHLAQCPDCAEEYEGLRLVARLEAEGRLPQAEESLAAFEEAPAREEGLPVGD
jgi:hypothetical protein